MRKGCKINNYIKKMQSDLYCFITILRKDIINSLFLVRRDNLAATKGIA